MPVTVEINQDNIENLLYNIETEECTIQYKGGSKIKYKNFTNEMFERVILQCNAKTVLQEIRSGNIVGVRI